MNSGERLCKNLVNNAPNMDHGQMIDKEIYVVDLSIVNNYSPSTIWRAWTKGDPSVELYQLVTGAPCLWIGNAKADKDNRYVPLDIAKFMSVFDSMGDYEYLGTQKFEQLRKILVAGVPLVGFDRQSPDVVIEWLKGKMHKFIRAVAWE